MVLKTISLGCGVRASLMLFSYLGVVYLKGHQMDVLYLCFCYYFLAFTDPCCRLPRAQVHALKHMPT